MKLLSATMPMLQNLLCSFGTILDALSKWAKSSDLKMTTLLSSPLVLDEAILRMYFNYLNTNINVYYT